MKSWPPEAKITSASEVALFLSVASDETIGFHVVEIIFHCRDHVSDMFLRCI
jgi:hypothetical protein